MISKLIGAMALTWIAVAVQAQGVVAPLDNTQSASTNPPSTSAESVSPAASPGFNPFKPPAPAAAPTVDADLPPPPTPVDPVVVAIAEEMRTIREEGERVGVIDGKVIFRHKGRYLIEAVIPEELSNGDSGIDPAKREAALAGECVIRVITDSNKNETKATASKAEPTQTR